MLIAFSLKFIKGTQSIQAANDVVPKKVEIHDHA
jgi:hypothetical protein